MIHVGDTDEDQTNSTGIGFYCNAVGTMKGGSRPYQPMHDEDVDYGQHFQYTVTNSAINGLKMIMTSKENDIRPLHKPKDWHRMEQQP